MGRIAYMSEETVLEAAHRRMAFIFDHFENVVVSISGGKDSTVLHHLASTEALKGGRTVTAFFLDQEAEYQSTVDQIGLLMRAPGTIPRWIQAPCYMTNATSHVDDMLFAWGPGEEWIRPKDPIAIHELPEPYPKRFYDFFEWQERQCLEDTAFLVGIRSTESFNRFRAVTKRTGWKDIRWSTKAAGNHAWRFYPIYDWFFGDVWKYIIDEGLPYNKLYDRLFALRGANMRTMRVSNLLHEQSFRCLSDLQELEPETYERLLKRIGGVHAAALYSREAHVYDAKALPAAYPTWRAYRDYLMATTPLEKMDRLRKRFSRQATDEHTCRQQVKQLLCNDWEGNLPVSNPKLTRLREVWWDRL